MNELEDYFNTPEFKNQTKLRRFGIRIWIAFIQTMRMF
jgi:hypothetical protein